MCSIMIGWGRLPHCGHACNHARSFTVGQGVQRVHFQDVGVREHQLRALRPGQAGEAAVLHPRRRVQGLVAQEDAPHLRLLGPVRPAATPLLAHLLLRHYDTSLLRKLPSPLLAAGPLLSNVIVGKDRLI